MYILVVHYERMLHISCIYAGLQSELTDSDQGKQNLTRRNSSLDAEINAQKEIINSLKRKSREEKVMQ